MTLTHILPSLRRTIADPLNRDNWPEHTTSSPTDVTIAGLSLVTLVQWCGTPCVHTAAAVIRGTHGRPSETELASVVVARVTSVARENGQLSVWVDAELDRCAAICSEARLIGRASVAHGAAAILFPASPSGVVHRALELPDDLEEGDLIVVPCIGVTLLRDVQNRSIHPERVSDDRVDHERDQFPFLPVCGR
jgi:hypothetical protein